LDDDQVPSQAQRAYSETLSRFQSRATAREAGSDRRTTKAIETDGYAAAHRRAVSAATTIYWVAERSIRMRLSYAIVFVSDMKKSIQFYRDAVGLPVRFESSHWTEFDTPGATLALHLSEGPDGGRLPGNTESPGGCRPGFGVPDLQSFHSRVVALGVKCVQEPKDVFGSQVAIYLDPDGLEVSVGEDRNA